MFADASLAARVDRGEAGMIRAIGLAAAARGRSVAELEVCGGAAFLAEPGSPLNNVLGAHAGPDQAGLARVEIEASARRVPVRFEIASLAEPALFSWLSARGYPLLGFEDVLLRPLSEPAAERDDVAVEPVGPRTVDVWLHASLRGFGALDGTGAAVDDPAGDAPSERFRDFAETDGMQHWLARVDGEVAGTGGLYVGGEFAWLVGASTLPEFRRRGVQQALIAARLAHARRAGCRVAVVTTALGSRSQANAVRAGFALSYTRAVLSRDP